MRSAIILNLVVLGVLVSGAGAAEQLVPGQYATIQAAIDAAVDGDEVIVADGVYTGDGNRDIDFLGKAITVRSENGPENCVIDCEREGRGFYLSNGEGANSVLDGLTITNGTTYTGGGIYCEGGSPTITNCTINSNLAYRYGSGIYFEGGSPTITNCTISENYGYYSGGIHFLKSNATVENCILKGNDLAPHYGTRPVQASAICCEKSDIELIDSIVTGNSFGGGGAIGFDESTARIVDCNISQNLDWGIYCQTGSLVVKGCSISENSAWGYGGGIFCSDSSLVMGHCAVNGNTEGIFCYEGTAIISDCTISHNSSSENWGVISCSGRLVINDSIISGNIINSKQPWGGGGITLVDSIDSGYGPSEISNCLITGNVVEKGGTIASYCENAAITNCTISGNTAEMGASIFCGYGIVTASNCIMWGNAAQDGSQIYLGSVTDTSGNQYYSELAVGFSDVEGGLDAIHVEPNCVFNWGEGNIDGEPLFGEMGWWDANGTPEDVSDDFWVEGDYHLLEESVCINAGDPDYVAGPNETDLDGVPRVLFGRIDMGAYEYNYIETEMEVTPAMLNCGSGGNWVEAHFVLPEGYLPEDVDVNTPAVAEPISVESEAIEVLDEGDGYYRIVAVFGREAFCEAFGGDEEKELEVTVIGLFTDGVRFYGTDTIKLISDHWQHQYKKQAVVDEKGKSGLAGSP